MKNLKTKISYIVVGVVLGVVVTLCVTKTSSDTLIQENAQFRRELALRDLKYKRREDSLRIYRKGYRQLSIRYGKRLDSLLKEVNVEANTELPVDSALKWIEEYNSQR